MTSDGFVPHLGVLLCSKLLLFSKVVLLLARVLV